VGVGAPLQMKLHWSKGWRTRRMNEVEKKVEQNENECRGELQNVHPSFSPHYFSFPILGEREFTPFKNARYTFSSER
jgi:hypothetical protein